MQHAQRILVIDDEPDVGKFIKAAAEGLGSECLATTDHAVFLEELNADTSLIFLDLMMPQIDGIELLRLLSRQGCRVPIVLMSGVGNRILETAEQLAGSLGLRIVGHLNKPFRLKELQQMLSGSITPPELAKVSPKLQAGISDDDLRRAIADDEFVVYYQPQIEFKTGAVIGVEALVRWKHSVHGLVFPDQFINRLEKLGLIDQLGWIVFEHGMREVRGFTDAQGNVPNLSLNASVHSIRDLEFPDKLQGLISKHGLSPENITIEITETAVIEELSFALDVLTRLRLKGVLLSIDDFGTGFAMMQQLRNVPATELKIDKSFVQNIHLGLGDRVIVQKIIEIGHDLGMKVMGEGVETQEQFDFLLSNRCDGLQGYLYSRPLPVKQLVAWLADYRSRQAARRP